MASAACTDQYLRCFMRQGNMALMSRFVRGNMKVVRAAISGDELDAQPKIWPKHMYFSSSSQLRCAWLCTRLSLGLAGCQMQPEGKHVWSIWHRLVKEAGADFSPSTQTASP